MSRAPIIYLIAIEDIIRSPLIHSQVINVLKAMLKQGIDRPLIIVSLYPVTNWWKYRDQIDQLKEELAKDKIHLITVPILFFTRYFYIPLYLQPLYWVQAFFITIWIASFLRPALIHCRSYPSAIVGYLMRKLFRCHYIFDTRSLYAEEAVSVDEGKQLQKFSESSYHLWKMLEKWLVISASATTVVSPPCLDYFARWYPSATNNLVFIPATAAVANFSQLEIWRTEKRKELHFGQTITLAYVGSWFVADQLSQLIHDILKSHPNQEWSFLFLVNKTLQAQANEFIQHLKQEFPHIKQHHIFCVMQSEVASYLASADIAILPSQVQLLKQTETRYRIRSSTVLSVKFVEYLAAGLPVLANREWAGAAAQIVETYDLGCLYQNAQNNHLVDWLAHWQRNSYAYRQRTWQYAHEHFSLEQVAGQYLNLYKKILD